MLNVRIWRLGAVLHGGVVCLHTLILFVLLSYQRGHTQPFRLIAHGTHLFCERLWWEGRGGAFVVGGEKELVSMRESLLCICKYLDFLSMNGHENLVVRMKSRPKYVLK